MNKKSQLVRVSEHAIDKILALVPDNHWIDLDGGRIKGDTLKLRCFKEHGTQCHLCGLKATYFALDYHTKNDGYILTLYGADSWTKDDIEFTVDHIIPRSKGGKGEPENIQTMCAPCNQLLGRLLTFRKELKAKRRMREQRKLVKTVRPFKQG